MTYLSPRACLDDIILSLGPDLSSLMVSDSSWTDLMFNPDGRVWLDKEGMEEIKCKETREQALQE